MKKLMLLFISSIVILNTNLYSQQWQECNNGIDGRNIQALAVSGNNLYAGSYEYGIFLSTDQGANWSNISSELTNLQVVSLAASGSNVYAGIEGSDGGMYLTTNNGGTWTEINSGLTNNMIYSIIIDGSNIYAGTWGDGVFLSINNGTSWNPINEGLDNLKINCLAVRGLDIFAGTQGKGVYHSTNYGQNWTQSGLSNSVVFGLAFSGTDIFAAIRNGGVIMISTNNGESWEDMNNGFTHNWGMRFHVMDSIILAGSWGGGVFLSTNKGANWSEFNSGLTGENVLGFVASNSNIFVGTQDAGVFKMNINFLPVEELMILCSVKLYPNPVDDILKIESNLYYKCKIQIYSLLGNKVFETDYTSMINVSALPEGVYYVIINSGNKKVIKKFNIVR